ncbi:MAG: hypothetical protein DRH56_07440 [Deltaproteobacteria bacterium]|nr:MAG: hypothetical protein DRH56_07440 [Deltaproteobacteria bacterium]
MEQKRKYRLRVENCIGTIIDVHRIIRDELDNEELLSHFESLQQAVESLDMSLVCEGDVLMVEQATNALLGEFKGIFEQGAFGPVYEGRQS